MNKNTLVLVTDHCQEDSWRWTTRWKYGSSSRSFSPSKKKRGVTAALQRTKERLSWSRRLPFTISRHHSSMVLHTRGSWWYRKITLFSDKPKLIGMLSR